MIGIGLGSSGNLQTSEMKEKGMSAIGKTVKKVTRQTEIRRETHQVKLANHFLTKMKLLIF
jgi:hypothetical protein